MGATPRRRNNNNNNRVGGQGSGQGAAKLAAMLGAAKKRGGAAAALAATLAATGDCSVEAIRNPIGASAFECTQLESGAQLASVGCPAGMTAVNIGCALFATGTFIPALGATGIVVGETASCAFPPRENVETEWASYPYALLLSCSYLDVTAQPIGRARAAERLIDAVEGAWARGGGGSSSGGGPSGKGKGWREAAATPDAPTWVQDTAPSRPARSSRARRGLLGLGGGDDAGGGSSSSSSADL